MRLRLEPKRLLLPVADSAMVGRLALCRLLESMVRTPGQPKSWGRLGTFLGATEKIEQYSGGIVCGLVKDVAEEYITLLNSVLKTSNISYANIYSTVQ